MKKFYIAVLPFLFTGFLSAQINHAGQPQDWANKSVATDVSFVKTAILDMISIRAEDEVLDSYKDTPYRFGIVKEVDLNFFENNEPSVTKNGDKIWHKGIHCPDATSINFVFDQFDIPAGAKVFIYNENRTEFLGAFTAQNMKEHGGLGIGIIHSDKIIIEYIQPADIQGSATLNISEITHGYRPVITSTSLQKGPFGNSGSCNINVNCPDADPWQDEKRSVGLILTGGGVCTGSLVNNYNNNGVPYFLTAQHCAGGENNWVIYFNHEYSGCSNSGSAPTNQSISGAVVKASNPASDGHLIQLTANIPASYQPYYNGWDASNTFVSKGVSIHHPSGDVKKISFDDDTVQKTFYGGSQSTSAGDNWRVEAWERNTTTEGGSSGSPLYDQDHRLIGQLQGGGSTCSNDLADWYGAFEASFDVYEIFLAGNTGIVEIDGYDPFAIPTTEITLKTFLEGPLVPDALVMTDDLRQSGTIPLTEPYTSLGYTQVDGGGETTSSAMLNVTGANAILDWVFIELRSATDPTVVVATRSALLQRDGDVVSVNGSSALTFLNLPSSVYVVMKHRNHFGMRTENTFSTTSDISVDFTDPTTALFGGTNAMATYGSIRAMIAGDANDDGQVNTTDKNSFWRLQNGTPYNYFNSRADFDLNAIVNTIDKTVYWRLNNSKARILD